MFAKVGNGQVSSLEFNSHRTFGQVTPDILKKNDLQRANSLNSTQRDVARQTQEHSIEQHPAVFGCVTDQQLLHKLALEQATSLAQRNIKKLNDRERAQLENNAQKIISTAEMHS